MDEPITADGALQIAEQIELKGQRFYTLAADMIADARARQPLLLLAGMEAEHAKSFAATRERLSTQPAADIDPNGETANYLRALLADRFFDPQVSPRDYLGGGESPQQILMTAIGMEKETIVFYEGLKQIVAAKEDAQAVSAIITEETRHISRLAGMLGPYVR